MIKDPLMDPTRMSCYPNLEYQNLYNAIAMLIDVASNIQYGIQAFGKAVLQCLGCLLPFLDRDLIDNLPYLTASCISVLPAALHQDVINSLCYFILPFTISTFVLMWLEDVVFEFYFQLDKVTMTKNATAANQYRLWSCSYFNIPTIQLTIVSWLNAWWH
jgi:hypothetical protein